MKYSIISLGYETLQEDLICTTKTYYISILQLHFIGMCLVNFAQMQIFVSRSVPISSL